MFWANDGLDEGPILLQKQVDIAPNDTVESLYNRFLFPEGIAGVREAVALIAAGNAPRIIQPEHGASYEDMLNKPHLSAVKFDNLSGKQLHDFIRGMDKVPGATIELNGEQVKLYGSRRWGARLPSTGAVEVAVQGMSRSGLIAEQGLFLFGNDNGAVCVQKLQLPTGKMINAANYGKIDETANIVFNETEYEQVAAIEAIWSSILNVPIDGNTDFFKSGAGSMDVTRLVEEIKEQLQLPVENEDVYMATAFDDFTKTVIMKSRGGSSATKLDVGTKAVVLQIDDKRKVSFPTQLFINNQFVDASQTTTTSVVNPTTEQVICEVQCATKSDVDRAVQAAHAAFNGEWSKMNARDRGMLLYRLAELMDKHREELAMIESIDSGAVYTLACKTHIGTCNGTAFYHRHLV